jgi:hypothetical protein
MQPLAGSRRVKERFYTDPGTIVLCYAALFMTQLWQAVAVIVDGLAGGNAATASAQLYALGTALGPTACLHVLQSLANSWSTAAVVRCQCVTTVRPPA